MKRQPLASLAGLFMLLPVTAGAGCWIGGVPARFTDIGSTNQKSIDALEESYGEKIKILRVYAHFGNHTGPQSRMRHATSNKMNLYYRLSPDNASGNSARIYRDIKNGVYDDVLLDHCNSLIDWIEENNRWVLFSFADEMNGHWKAYRVTTWGTGNAPGEFKAAWRRIHTLFRDRLAARGQGKGRIRFCFSPSYNVNNGGNPTYRQLKNIYPGDAYVDYAACNLYNRQEKWVNHLPVNSVLNAYSLAGANRPMGFGEVGCERRVLAKHTNSRPEWLRNNFNAATFRGIDLRYFHWYDTDVEKANQDDTYNALGDRASDNVLRNKLNNSFFIAR